MSLMSFADLVQPTLMALRWLCYLALLFYLLKVLSFIFKGKKPSGAHHQPREAASKGDAHRLREAMALGYTGVAAYFIFYATGAIQSFTGNVLNTGTLVNTPTEVNQFLVICAGVICVAFICNFCRSLWMLKLLDHAVFEPVSDWEQLTASLSKRLCEFIPRVAAALLFIVLELELEKLGHSSPEGDVAKGASTYTHLTDTGLYGLALYTCLILWWLSSRLIIKARMPRPLLVFYIAGLFNSSFIYFYGGEEVSAKWAWWMVLIVVFMGVAALYMIVIVFADVLLGLWGWLVSAWGWLMPRRGDRDGNDLADVQ